MKNIKSILQNAISPYEQYCSSSGMQPTDCYITTPTIGIGVADIGCSHQGSQMLDRTIAFDQAESSHANITQTNMIAVSSFNGLNGLVWGYDIAKKEDRRHVLLEGKNHLGVYDIKPLMDATQALYGTIERRRFPIAPGQHLVCAYKSHYHMGPCIIYGALALAIAADRDKNADLYMEDHGTLIASEEEVSIACQETAVLENLIRSVQRIGQNLKVEYKQIFVGLLQQHINAGQVGCALTAAPYIRIAKKAVEHNQVETFSEWENASLRFFIDT